MAGVAKKSSRAFELSLAAKLRQARQDAGMTQAEVGQALGISAEGYGNFERAARCIGVDQLRRAAELFAKPVAYFFGESADDLSSITDVERGHWHSARFVDQRPRYCSGDAARPPLESRASNFKGRRC